MPNPTLKERSPFMPLVKIGPKHQITIPIEVFDKLDLEVGDVLEVAAQAGKGIFIPKRLVPKTPAPMLSAKEQKVLALAKKKIAAIQKDLKNSKGLTREEADVAAKVGLINSDQKWWWLESWQEGEREAERDIEAGRVTVYDSPEAFLKSLANR